MTEEVETNVVEHNDDVIDANTTIKNLFRMNSYTINKLCKADITSVGSHFSGDSLEESIKVGEI